jgi:hypothetical protein
LGRFGSQNRINLTKFDHGFEAVLLILNGLSALFANLVGKITHSLVLGFRITGRRLEELRVEISSSIQMSLMASRVRQWDHEWIMRRTAEIIGNTDANFGGVFSVAYRELWGARA